MGNSAFIDLMLFIVISLFVGVILRIFLKKTFIPYTVGLFIVGLLIGCSARFEWFHMPQIIDSVLFSISDMDPYIILYFFLPILIFEASFNMNFHVFKKTFVSANLLAIPGVAIAMLLTGALLMLLSILFPTYVQWTWTLAFTFGALISATDPVAVVALLSELKTSKRFSTLVDSESMLNDGTGIVFFMLFFGSFIKEGLPFNPFVNFLITVFGAVASGMFVGMICIRLVDHTRSEPVLQSTVLITASYILFYVTNDIFQISGVISLVTFGLYIAYVGSTKLQAKVNTFIHNFWELLAYMGNTLIFLLVGIMIAMKCSFLWRDFGILFIVYVGVNIIRYIMIYIFFPIMRKMRYGFTFRETVVLGWGGLRGAVGLTLALVVFYTKSVPEPIRQQTLFLTAGIVTLTLCINATTMGWLLKKMKLTQKSPVSMLLQYNVKSLYAKKARESLDELKKSPYVEFVDWPRIEAYLPQEGILPEAACINFQTITATMRKRVMEEFMIDAVKLFHKGEIMGETQRELLMMIEDMDDRDGVLPLTDLKDYFKDYGQPSPRRKKIIEGHKFFIKLYNKHIIKCYDTLRGFIIMNRDALQMMETFKESPTLKQTELDSITLISAELQSNIEQAQKQFDVLEENYPDAYKEAVNCKVKRLLFTQEKVAINQLSDAGMINDEEAEAMKDDIGKKQIVKKQ